MKLTDTIQESYADIKAETQLLQSLAQSEEVYNEFAKMYETIKLPKNRVAYPSRDEQMYLIIEYYESIQKSINEKKISYTPSDILYFSLKGNDFSEKKQLGVFLSTLINFHHEKTANKEYFIDLSLYETPLDYVGFSTNGAHIIVNGDAGDNIGERMEKGRIIINGGYTS